METFATTRMSSKGQVVIPEDIRVSMGLHPGSQFLVTGQKDILILKSIQPPSMSDFASLVRETRAQAKRAGLKPSHITDAIRKVRAKA